MSLESGAGGRWREVWPGGQVEHGRVLFWSPFKALRLESATGPLQEMGVAGVQTWTLEGMDGGRTRISASYRVSGRAALKLDALAGAVDGVMCQQLKRLAEGSPPASP
jgi:hypothetical protein